MVTPFKKLSNTGCNPVPPAHAGACGQDSGKGGKLGNIGIFISIIILLYFFHFFAYPKLARQNLPHLTNIEIERRFLKNNN